MQADTYADVAETSSSEGRERERIAFDEGLALMEAAREAPHETERVQKAARHMQTLWGYLIRDLTNPANDLSDDLKANLVSIGLWVIKESDAIVAGRSQNFAGLIDINRTIREGLS